MKEAIEIRKAELDLNRDVGNKLQAVFNPLLICRRGQHGPSCDLLSHVMEDVTTTFL